MVCSPQHLVERFVAELVGDDPGRRRLSAQHRVADLDYFVEAVRTVAGGGTALDPEVVARCSGQAPCEPLDALTPREREVLQLMAEGVEPGHRRPARVGPRAVEKHVTSIFAKLDLGHDGRSRGGARGPHAAARQRSAAAWSPGRARARSRRRAPRPGPGARAALSRATGRRRRDRRQRPRPAAAHPRPDRHVDAARVRVLDGVGQRLGDEEVRGRLDLRREALLRHPQGDRDRQPRGELLERRAEPAIGEDERVDAGGELAQVVDRAAGVVGGPPEGSSARSGARRASSIPISARTSRCCAPSCRSRPIGAARRRWRRRSAPARRRPRPRSAAR